MIKAVLLDIDNTLLDFNKCAELSIKKSFAQNNLEYFNDVFKVFLKRNEMLWQAIERNEYTRERLHKERFNLIFKELGIEFNGEIIEGCFLNNLYDCVVKIEGANELVEYLSSKYFLCTASNAPNDQQYNRLKVAGFLPYIKNVFTSEALGASKPLPEFFDKCFQKMNGITPEQTVIIGDSLTADVRGGKSYGLKTIWYNHNKIEMPKDKPFDYAVEKLSEIKNIL